MGGKCFTGQLNCKGSSQNKIFLTTSCWPELVGAKFHFALWAKCEAGPYPVYSMPPMGLPTSPEGLCTWKSRLFCPALGYSVVSELGRPTVSQQDSAHVAALGPRSTCFNGIREGFPKTSALAFHQSFKEKTVRALWMSSRNTPTGSRSLCLNSECCVTGHHCGLADRES